MPIPPFDDSTYRAFLVASVTISVTVHKSLSEVLLVQLPAA